MIEAKHLVYRIGSKYLIDDVCLTLPGAEIVAILGPNGAGKSTLLRHLTGYLKPSSGTCSMFGKALSEWPILQLAKLRAVLRQNSSMVFPFSVTEVIRMGRYPYQSDYGNSETQHIMELCACQELADREYPSLSGGEQQRVQLARLLVQLWEPLATPKWLFLDEPTSALDIHHQQHLFRLLRQLVKNQKLNVCCVLHDLNLAALYADRIILMNQGRLAGDGTPENVLTESTLTSLYHADISVTQATSNAALTISLNR